MVGNPAHSSTFFSNFETPRLVTSVTSQLKSRKKNNELDHEDGKMSVIKKYVNCQLNLNNNKLKGCQHYTNILGNIEVEAAKFLFYFFMASSNRGLV